MPETTTALTFAAATSEADDTAEAMEQVIDRLNRKLSGPVDLCMVFATPHHAHSLDLVHELLRTTLSPRVELGATCEGVIGVRREVEMSSGLSVIAASLPGAVLSPFRSDRIEWTRAKQDPEEFRQSILGANAAFGGTNGVAEPKAILFMADPFSTAMLSVLPAFEAGFPGVPVIGGMASGSRRPGGNRLLYNGKVMTDAAVGVAIGGNVRIDCTVSQGCRPIGRPFVITKSRRHVVQELAGRSAMKAVQQTVESLPEEDRQLIQSNGLLVGRVINEYKDRFGRGDFLIRGLIGVDHEQGYIAIADPQVRVGQTIQFHVRDQKTAQEDFAMLLQMQQLHGEAAGALLFSCNGRGTRLFSQPNTDANLVHQALGDTPLAGFFAAGEIGPVGGQNFVHGHTASLMVFREGRG